MEGFSKAFSLLQSAYGTLLFLNYRQKEVSVVTFSSLNQCLSEYIIWAELFDKNRQRSPSTIVRAGEGLGSKAKVRKVLQVTLQCTGSD